MDWLKNRLDAASFDFVAYRHIAAVVSTILVLGSWLVFVVPGPNWGIDFTGGTEIHLRFEEDVAIREVRDALDVLEIPNDAVQEVGSATGSEFKVRIQDAEFGAEAVEEEVIAALKAGMGEDWVADWDADVTFNAEVGARFSVRYQGDRLTPDVVAKALKGVDGVKVEEGRDDNEMILKLPGLSSQVEEEIRVAMGDRAFEVLSVDAVGPKVGASLRRQGFISLLATLGLVLLYVAFRFDVAFAPGAIVALVHDVSVTVGVFVLLGKEFNLPIIGALLTIVGYSLNDTIVIYDRIRENQSRFRREDLATLVNTSINETLSRTIATSATTFFAVVAFVFVGSPVIRDFVLAMICGIFFGTYSTVFVASPMILAMERIKPALSSLIAVPEGEASDDLGIPEEFLSESEKRRRERAQLEKADAGTLGEG